MQINKTVIWFSRWFYFLLAHLPFKILANATLFTAIFSLMIQGALYYGEKHPDKLQQLIADYLLIDADFSSVKSDFNLLYPSLRLNNLTVNQPFNKQPWLSFNSVAVSVDLLKSLVTLQPKLNFFILDGLKTTLSRDRQGNIYLGDNLVSNHKVQQDGINSQEKIPTHIWLLSQKFLSLSNSQIELNDEITGISGFVLNDINIALKNSWWHHQLSLSFGNQKGQQEFDGVNLIMDFEGSIHKIYDWKGDFYFSVDDFDFKQQDQRLAYQIYKKLLKKQQFTILSAQLDGQLWGKIDKGQVSAVSGFLEHGQLTLRDEQNDRSIEFNNFFSDFAVLNVASIFGRQSFQDMSGTMNNDSWHFIFNELEFDIGDQMVAIDEIAVDIEKIKELGSSISSYRVHSFIEELQLKPLTPLFQQLLPKQQDMFESLNISGKLDNIHSDLIIRDKELADLKIYTQLQSYQQSAWQDIPPLSGLSADFWINYQFRDGQASSDGVVSLDAPGLELYLHRLFRDAWRFEQAKATLSWQQIGDLTWIDSRAVEIQNDHLQLAGDAEFWLDGKNSPIMMIDAYYQKVNAAHTSLYLPAGVMDKELVRWLDEGILSGRVPDGGVLYRGRLSDFPYTDHSGNMDIVFNTRKVKLNYKNDWPIVTDINGRTTFTETGMWIEGYQAKVLDAVSQDTFVSLNDYMDGIVRVNSKVKGKAKDGLLYLQQSDILSPDHVKSLTSDGDIDIDLRLIIPTDSDDDKITSKINVTLSDVAFVPQWLSPSKLTEINGKLMIENGFMNAKNISGKLKDEKVSINILTEPESKDVDAITQLAVDTRLSTETILQSGFVPSWLEPIFPYLNGKTALHVNLLIPNNREIFPQVVVLSSLKGIQSDLPKPFNKDSLQALDFQLSYSEDNRHSQFNVELGDIVNVTTELLGGKANKEHKLNRLGLSFGFKKAPLPRKEGVIVQGNLDLTEMDHWKTLFDNRSGDKPQLLDFRLPIKIAMDRINLPALFKQDDKQSEQQSESKPLQAKALPTINGFINSVSVAGEHLGKFKIASSQDEQLYRLKNISLNGDVLDLELNGVWRKTDKSPTTRVEGSMQLDDVGKVSEIVGYDSVTKKADMKFDGFITWNGSPLAFNYKKLQGNVKLKTGAGYFNNIDPGVARVLGLFNLNKIAKRINLDFSDVSGKGFNFENINAEFVFGDGKLHTRDLMINSSIAQINIDGHLDLVEEEFDELVTIIPNISSGLTLAGAAIAGPVGAAAGWIGHKLVGKQVNKISQYQHKITGSWEEPDISLVKLEGNLEEDL